MPSDFLEKTLEDIIFENKDFIHNHGLPKFRKTVFRQFVLPSGKKLDIFSYDLIDGNIVIDIYELKRYEINADAICQAYNYFMEVSGFVAARFKSIDIHIIMIGRYYDPIMIFEKINLPFSVYTYDYKLSGMTFVKHQERRHLKTPNDDFCFGLWAFGSGSIYYPIGQPDTVNLANIYASWKNNNKEAHSGILTSTGTLFSDPVIKEIKTTEIKYIKPQGVKTEYFPLQPCWSTAFANTIPPDEYMLDLDIDESDYELEPYENDTSDFEPEIEEEDWQRATSITLEERNLEITAFMEQLPHEEEYPMQPLIVDENSFEIKKVNDFLKRISQKSA